MRGTGAVTGLLRRRRAERGVAAALFVLVAVTSLVVALCPRLFEKVADDGLRYAVERGTAVQRNLQFTAIGRIRPGDTDPMAFVDTRGENLMGRLPASVQEVIDVRDFLVESPRLGLDDPPNYRAFVTLRYEEEVEGRLAMEAGRMPASAEQSSDPDARPRIEIALSAASATELGVDVGDILRSTVDPTDPMVQPLFPRPTAEVELVVAGLFSLVDPTDPAWFDDPALAQPAIRGSAEAPIAFATALFAPAAYEQVEDLGLPGRYRWRYHVAAERFDAGRLDALVPDLRRLDTTFGGNRAAGGVIYRSGLLDIIETYQTQRATTEAVLSVAAIGPLAVAAAALGLVAVIVVRRRRADLALARGRGASTGQLLSAQLWEGLLITVPATIAGLLTARLSVPARADPVSAVGSVVVAAGVTALLLAATWPRARGTRRELDRDDAPPRRLAPRRLVVEATIVGIALAAAWLLRVRGLGSQRAETGTATFDPFLAATPVLIGIAVALLTIRLYPLPLRALGWASARRRDLVLALGLRTIGRDPGSANLPLLVVTLTVAIGVFSSILAFTLERGQTAASWQAVGADYRIDADRPNGLPETLRLAGVTGVEAVTGAVIDQSTRVSGFTERAASITIMAVDAPRYRAVLVGSPLTPPFAGEFDDPPVASDTGTPTRPIPAVVSRRVPSDWPATTIGDTFEVGFRGQPMTVQVVDVAEATPGLPRAVPFLVVPFASLDAGWSAPALRPTVLFVRGSAATGVALADALDAEPVEVTSRHAVLASQQATPLIGAISSGFGLAVMAATAYAGLAIVAVVALDAQRRARELAYLRTLGLTSRQSGWLTFVEHAPPTVLALGVGVALGLGVAWLLEPGLGLGAFIGPEAPVRLQVDWLAVGAITVIVLVVVATMVAASSWLARRFDPVQALRIGDA